MSVPESEKPPYYPTITKSQASSILVLVFVFACLFALVSFMPKAWEYKLLSVPDADFAATMNGVGNDGWELVSARRATSDPLTTAPATFSYEMIFKRRK